MGREEGWKGESADVGWAGCRPSHGESPSSRCRACCGIQLTPTSLCYSTVDWGVSTAATASTDRNPNAPTALEDRDFDSDAMPGLNLDRHPGGAGTMAPHHTGVMQAPFKAPPIFSGERLLVYAFLPADARTSRCHKRYVMVLTLELLIHLRLPPSALMIFPLVLSSPPH